MMVNLPVIQTIEKPVSGEWGTEPSGGHVIKVLRNTNFNNDGSLNLKDVVEREIPGSKVSSKKLNYGDILIEKSGGSPNQPVGRVVFFDRTEGEYLFSNFTSALRPKAGFFPKYLFYLLFGNHLFKKTLAYQNKTTGILNLQLERYLKESLIPIPSFEDQQRIATILDHADSIRRKNRQILEKYDELAKSIFYEMFGDPIINSKRFDIKKLADLTHLITDGKHGDSRNDENSGYYFISAKDVHDGFIDYRKARQILKKDFEEVHKRTNLKSNDLVIVNTGATIGKTAIVSDDPRTNRTTFQKSVAVIKTKTDFLLPEFLKFIFILRIKALAGIASGSAVQNLLLSQIKTFRIIVPPIKAQMHFKEIINKIETQKQLTFKSLQKSEDLFHSLLQRAFRGEL